MRARKALERAQEETTVKLSAVEKRKPGTGRIDLFAFGRGDELGHVAGGGLDYEHRLARNLAAFGRGLAGVAWDGGGRGLYYDVLTGVRWSW